jgi:osmoprotectant transport system substrate-binding protein
MREDLMTRRTYGRAAVAAVALTLVAAACGGDDGDSDTGAGGGTTAVAGGETASSAAEPATFTFKPLDAGGPITKAALSSGDIDIALLFSSDADIAVNGWVALEDDKQLQQLENLTPAIRIDKNSEAITEALNAVSAELTTDELIEMNRQNSAEDKAPKDIAETWLTDNDLLPYDGSKVSGSLKVGSTNFAEQEIVAELYSQVLESAGASIERKFQLGAREVVAAAIEAGDIDVYPEYLGSFLLYLDENATVPTDPAEAAEALNTALEPKGVEVLEPAEAQDTNTFVVTKETADEHSLSKVSDLASVSEPLVLGGPPECPERPFCLIGLKDTYGLSFDV